MDALLTNKDVMRIFSISDETIPRLRKSGLQYLKVGSEYRYKLEWIEDYKLYIVTPGTSYTDDNGDKHTSPPTTKYLCDCFLHDISIKEQIGLAGVGIKATKKINLDSFLSDAANAISDLRGNVTSLADFTEEKLTNAILSSFKYQILSNALKPMYDDLADMFRYGNIDASAANDWKQRLTDILNTNSKELDKIFSAFGIDPKEVGSSSQTPSSGYSVSMSQDTGDKLVGIETGSQMRLISLDQNVARIAQWNQPVSEKFNFDTIAMPLGVLSQSSLRIERMMEENRNIAIQMFYLVRDIKGDTANLSAIKDGINSMNSKLDNI